MIDILLATYNGEKFIEEQLKSILRQDRDNLDTDINLIIRDDGSTDNTVSIMNNIVNDYNSNIDSPMKVTLHTEGKPTGSPAGNFMKLLSISKADYVMFSDQDDIWKKRKTEATYSYMKKLERRLGSDTPILVHTDLSLIDAEGNKTASSFYEYSKLPREDSLNQLLIQNTVTGCAMMLNRAAVQLLKQVPVSEMELMHDHYAAVLVAATGKVALLDEPLIRYRQHGENMVGAHSADSSAEVKSRMSRGRVAFQKSMDLSYRQADFVVKRFEAEILKTHGQEYVDLLKSYSNLIMAGKIERIRFFVKNGIYKNGALKKAVQLIWC